MSPYSCVRWGLTYWVEDEERSAWQNGLLLLWPHPNLPPQKKPSAGVVLPLLSQTVMFWQVLLARFMLRKHLGGAQLAGVALVVAGVVTAAWPSRTAGSVFQHVSG